MGLEAFAAAAQRFRSETRGLGDLVEKDAVEEDALQEFLLEQNNRHTPDMGGGLEDDGYGSAQEEDRSDHRDSNLQLQSSEDYREQYEPDKGTLANDNDEVT